MKSNKSAGYSKWLTTCIVCLATAYFAYYTVINFDAIPRFDWNFPAIITLFVSIVFVVFNVVLAGLIWQFLLRDAGINHPWSMAQIVILISQFGKYLPGNIGQHVGRVVIAGKAGIPVSTTMGTMLIELLWGVSVASCLSLLSVLMFGVGEMAPEEFYFDPAIFLFVMIVPFLIPWVAIHILNRNFPRLVNRLSGGRKFVPPRPLTALIVAFLFLLSFILIGIVLKLQCQWFFGVINVSLLEITCLFAVIWLAGYIVPGAPGGLGVRESLMVLLFSPLIGAGTAIGVGITLRLTTTLGDAVAFAIGLLLRKIILAKHNGARDIFYQ